MRFWFNGSEYGLYRSTVVFLREAGSGNHGFPMVPHCKEWRQRVCWLPQDVSGIFLGSGRRVRVPRYVQYYIITSTVFGAPYYNYSILGSKTPF